MSKETRERCSFQIFTRSEAVGWGRSDFWISPTVSLIPTLVMNKLGRQWVVSTPWFSNLASQRKHLESLINGLMFGPTPMHSDLFGLLCSLGSRGFKSSPGDFFFLSGAKSENHKKLTQGYRSSVAEKLVLLSPGPASSCQGLSLPVLAKIFWRHFHLWPKRLVSEK